MRSLVVRSSAALETDSLQHLLYGLIFDLFICSRVVISQRDVHAIVFNTRRSLCALGLFYCAGVLLLLLLARGCKKKKKKHALLRGHSTRGFFTILSLFQCSPGNHGDDENSSSRAWNFYSTGEMPGMYKTRTAWERSKNGKLKKLPKARKCRYQLIRHARFITSSGSLHLNQPAQSIYTHIGI